MLQLAVPARSARARTRPLAATGKTSRPRKTSQLSRRGKAPSPSTPPPCGSSCSTLHDRMVIDQRYRLPFPCLWRPSLFCRRTESASNSYSFRRACISIRSLFLGSVLSIEEDVPNVLSSGTESRDSSSNPLSTFLVADGAGGHAGVDASLTVVESAGAFDD